MPRLQISDSVQTKAQYTIRVYIKTGLIDYSPLPSRERVAPKGSGEGAQSDAERAWRGAYSAYLSAPAPSPSLGYRQAFPSPARGKG